MSRWSSISAARTSGFLYIQGHGLAPELVSAVESAAASFFALPGAVKNRYYIGLFKNHRGYVPPGEEVFTVKRRAVTRKRPSTSASSYPRTIRLRRRQSLARAQCLAEQELPEFRRAVSAYYEGVFALGRRLLPRLLARSRLAALAFRRRGPEATVSAQARALPAERADCSAGGDGDQLPHRLRGLHDLAHHATGARGPERRGPLDRRSADPGRLRGQSGRHDGGAHERTLGLDRTECGG